MDVTGRGDGVAAGRRIGGEIIDRQLVIHCSYPRCGEILLFDPHMEICQQREGDNQVIGRKENNFYLKRYENEKMLKEDTNIIYFLSFREVGFGGR